jgi:hypothetical protein
MNQPVNRGLTPCFPGIGSPLSLARKGFDIFQRIVHTVYARPRRCDSARPSFLLQTENTLSSIGYAPDGQAHPPAAWLNTAA